MGNASRTRGYRTGEARYADNHSSPAASRPSHVNGTPGAVLASDESFSSSGRRRPKYPRATHTDISAMRAGSFLLMTTPLNNGGIAPICRVMLFRLLAHGTRRACRGESHRISRRSIWMDDGRGGNGPGTRFGHPKMPCPLGGGSEKKEGTDVAPVPQVSERAFPARTNRHRVRRCPAALVAKGNPKEAVRLIRVDVSS
jgi:hypothetical protein